MTSLCTLGRRTSYAIFRDLDLVLAKRTKRLAPALTAQRLVLLARELQKLLAKVNFDRNGNGSLYD